MGSSPFCINSWAANGLCVLYQCVMQMVLVLSLSLQFRHRFDKLKASMDYHGKCKKMRENLEQ